MITHWDEIEGTRREKGHIAASWQSLTGANSVGSGVRRISIEPDRWATPLHLEGSEEEIFYVLSGTGISYQGDGENEAAHAVGPGDCLVHLALENAHTIGAGPAGLVVLAFGLVLHGAPVPQTDHPPTRQTIGINLRNRP